MWSEGLYFASGMMFGEKVEGVTAGVGNCCGVWEIVLEMRRSGCWRGHHMDVELTKYNKIGGERGSELRAK